MPYDRFFVIVSAQYNLFKFIELVNSQNSFCVLAVRPRLTAIAGRKRDVFLRQIIFFKHLAGVITHYGYFRRADQIFIVTNFIYFILAVRQPAGSGKIILSCYGRRNKRGKSFLEQMLKRELPKRERKLYRFIFEKIPPKSRNLCSSFRINQI